MLVNKDHPDGLFVPTTKVPRTLPVGSADMMQLMLTQVDAVDTVGAGDCFCGAFAHFYTEGTLIHHAIHSDLELY
jgi:fructose-1-phosphate kinase PfkB-like protein